MAGLLPFGLAVQIGQFRARPFLVYDRDRMSVDEVALNEVVRRLLAVAKPTGSFCSDRPRLTKDSDIDLLIVEPTAENRHEESVAIRGRDRRCPLPG